MEQRRSNTTEHMDGQAGQRTCCEIGSRSFVLVALRFRVVTRLEGNGSPTIDRQSRLIVGTARVAGAMRASGGTRFFSRGACPLRSRVSWQDAFEPFRELSSTLRR